MASKGPGRRVCTGIAGLAMLTLLGSAQARAQVFTVGEKSATSDINTDFRPTHVELPDGRLSERGRRELVRDLEAELGFAHRVLPLGATVTLQANGNLTPGAEAYRKLVYEKGQSAAVGDRVIVSSLEFKPDRIIVDLNGGPYAKHRFMRHIQIGMGGTTTNPQGLNDGGGATGCRVTLVFEGGVPEISAPQVKSLLYPLVDFGVKTGEMAYAETLPEPVKQAIATHEVLVGMNRRMVLAALGAPESKVRETSENGEHYEEWIYGHQPQTVKFVRFVGDQVTLLKIAAIGKPMEIHDQDEMAAYHPQTTKTVAQGDLSQGDAQARVGTPTLKKSGEVLPEEVNQQVQNGRVQYPVEKKPDPAASTPPPATPPPGPCRTAAELQYSKPAVIHTRQALPDQVSFSCDDSFRAPLEVTPDILTERLRLVAMTPERLHADFAHTDDFESLVGVNVPQQWPPQHWEPHVLDFLEAHFAENPATMAWHRYIVLRGHPDTLIGTVGGFLKTRSEAEVGYSVLEPWQRRGYASEALRAVLAAIFADEAVQSVIAQNISSSDGFAPRNGEGWIGDRRVRR